MLKIIFEEPNPERKNFIALQLMFVLLIVILNGDTFILNKYIIFYKFLISINVSVKISFQQSNINFFYTFLSLSLISNLWPTFKHWKRNLQRLCHLQKEKHFKVVRQSIVNASQSNNFLKAIFDSLLSTDQWQNPVQSSSKVSCRNSLVKCLKRRKNTYKAAKIIPLFKWNIIFC